MRFLTGGLLFVSLTQVTSRPCRLHFYTCPRRPPPSFNQLTILLVSFVALFDHPTAKYDVPILSRPRIPKEQDKMESVRAALQPVLQPITHNLPPHIRDLGVSLLGEQCYSNLVLDIDVTDADCLKLAVSKALGIGIVAASSIVKVPQIINLVRSRSASGVSFLSYLLETTSYLISLAYNFRNGFPFSTYGETACILVQNVVITVLVLNYSGRAGLAAVFVAALAASSATLFMEDVLDMGMLGYLQAGAGTLGVASKLPQILAIWQEGGTGQLSAFTVSPQRTPHVVFSMSISQLFLSMPHPALIEAGRCDLPFQAVNSPYQSPFRDRIQGCSRPPILLCSFPSGHYHLPIRNK